jgi:hypothetical protein
MFFFLLFQVCCAFANLQIEGYTLLGIDQKMSFLQKEERCLILRLIHQENLFWHEEKILSELIREKKQLLPLMNELQWLDLVENENPQNQDSKSFLEEKRQNSSAKILKKDLLRMISLLPTIKILKKEIDQRIPEKERQYYAEIIKKTEGEFFYLKEKHAIPFTSEKDLFALFYIHCINGVNFINNYISSLRSN